MLRAASDNTLYSASIEDSAMVGWSLLDQAIGDSPNL
jgi:hypothetical protein